MSRPESGPQDKRSEHPSCGLPYLALLYNTLHIIGRTGSGQQKSWSVCLFRLLTCIFAYFQACTVADERFHSIGSWCANLAKNLQESGLQMRHTVGHLLLDDTLLLSFFPSRSKSHNETSQLLLALAKYEAVTTSGTLRNPSRQPSVVLHSRTYRRIQADQGRPSVILMLHEYAVVYCFF